MKENKLLKQQLAWYTYTDIETGEIIKFQSKEFIPLMEEREDVREQIYKRICGLLFFNTKMIHLI